MPGALASDFTGFTGLRTGVPISILWRRRPSGARRSHRWTVAIEWRRGARRVRLPGRTRARTHAQGWRDRPATTHSPRRRTTAAGTSRAAECRNGLSAVLLDREAPALRLGPSGR